jgi:hypothetical protein
MLRDTECTAAQALLSLGIDLPDVQEELLCLADEEGCLEKTDLSAGAYGHWLWRRLTIWMRRHQSVLLFDLGLWSTLGGLVIAVGEYHEDPLAGATIGAGFGLGLVGLICGAGKLMEYRKDR